MGAKTKVLSLVNKLDSGASAQDKTYQSLNALLNERYRFALRLNNIIPSLHFGDELVIPILGSLLLANQPAKPSNQITNNTKAIIFSAKQLAQETVIGADHRTLLLIKLYVETTMPVNMCRIIMTTIAEMINKTLPFNIGLVMISTILESIGDEQAQSLLAHTDYNNHDCLTYALLGSRDRIFSDVQVCALVELLASKKGDFRRVNIHGCNIFHLLFEGFNIGFLSIEVVNCISSFISPKDIYALLLQNDLDGFSPMSLVFKPEKQKVLAAQPSLRKPLLFATAKSDSDRDVIELWHGPLAETPLQSGPKSNLLRTVTF